MLIEGDDPAVASGEGFRLPVKGRIAIVVYVAVGEAAPKLEIEKTGWMQQNGQRVPALFVRNTGNAHGRLAGIPEWNGQCRTTPGLRAVLAA